MNTSTSPASLESSIPANNIKIVEIYNKLRSSQLVVNTDYQRKLVLKKLHKLNFIETILKNYPFPEVYISPKKLDEDNLILIDEIVDGQQRLNTIKDYIEGTDIFALNNNSAITKFNNLSQEEKQRFLNYEISVRYLKNVNQDQVRDIFQRINKTDYALNAMEKMNAQWGESEFVCFAKQIIDTSYTSDNLVYKMDSRLRQKFALFFYGNDVDDIFSENDISRMLALQYVMVLVATMDLQSYFNRNEKLKEYVESYNEEFPNSYDIASRLEIIIDFLNDLNLRRTSRWFNKANLFTLFIELDKTDTTKIDKNQLSNYLGDFDSRAMLSDYGLEASEVQLNSDEAKYISLAREAVNEKSSREFRGHFMQTLFSRNYIVANPT